MSSQDGLPQIHTLIYLILLISMKNKFTLIIFIEFLFSIPGNFIIAQDHRYQYPAVLSNSFTGVSIGYINYPFSNFQLEPGYGAASIHVPHTAVRIILFGHEFNKYLSAQITYMRPVDWVEYKNVNNDNKRHTVWMNEVGLTGKIKSPAWKKFSLYAEGGMVLVTRRGFSINNST